MKIGIKTGQSQSGYTYEELSSVWSKAEELGFDSAMLHDHLFAVSFTDRPSDPCLEGYTTLAALARDTKRLRLGLMVTCAGYRNPAYLAKVGATIDVISKGRFTMGIGAGWNEAEYVAYGYKFPSVADRLGQLRETLKILRLMWTEESPSFSGKHFSIAGATCNPRPVQRTPPIWVGISTGTRTLPRIALKLADGLNTTANPGLCGEIIGGAEHARREMGRERSEVTYTAQPIILVGSASEIDLIVRKESKRIGMQSKDFLAKLKDKRCIIGAPEKVARELRAYGKAGTDYLIPMIIGDRLIWPLEIVKDKLLPLL